MKKAEAGVAPAPSSKTVSTELPIEPVSAELPIEPVSAEPPVEPVSSGPLHDWSSLQSNLELSGAAREFARNLQLESADENRWRFLVPDTLQHLGSESVVQSLQSALSRRLGHAVLLDLHTASEPVKSVAAATEHAELDRISEAEHAIDEDATVQEMKEKFGAKIIPDSIQPLQ